jgi:ribosome-binding protein aMBF1 (putative translation factor)
MARTRNFADVLRKELAADPALAKRVGEEWFNADIAQKVYDSRTAAGLTQKQLAERCETQQSVISRIEDADYEGHSLSLLKRIAEALGHTLRVEFCALPYGVNGTAKARGGKRVITKPKRKKGAKLATR